MLTEIIKERIKELEEQVSRKASIFDTVDFRETTERLAENRTLYNILTRASREKSKIVNNQN